MKKRWIRFPAFLLFVTLFIVPDRLRAQDRPFAAGIAVFIHAPGGESLETLKGADFKLVQAGKQLPATMHRPAPAANSISNGSILTFVLVVFDSRFAAPNDVAVLQKLQPLWRAGDLVSVQLPGLSASPFAAASQKVRHSIASLPPAPDATAETAKSIERLGQLRGRRVVLYVLGQDGMNALKIPQQLISLANDAMAQLYIVDGGRPAGSSDYLGPVTHVRGSGLSQFPAQTELGYSPKVSYPAENMFSLGVFHEISLGVAVQKLLADAGNYFDFTLQCTAAACFNPYLPLLIEIGRQGPLRITAEGYGLASGVALTAQVK